MINCPVVLNDVRLRGGRSGSATLRGDKSVRHYRGAYFDVVLSSDANFLRGH